MNTLANIFHLGIKEFRSLYRDPAMLALIAFAFSIGIYSAARSQPETLQSAPIAIVDEDRTPLSTRVTDSLYPPYFQKPTVTSQQDADLGMDTGRYSFSLDIPPNFQSDVIAGRNPGLQLNVDGTLVSQAYIGAGYIQSIVSGEVSDFVQRYRAVAPLPSDLEPRTLFNPNLTQAWFTAVMELINNVTMLSIILSGAALVRVVDGRRSLACRDIRVGGDGERGYRCCNFRLNPIISPRASAHPVSHNIDGYLPGNHRTIDATIRASGYSRPASARCSLWLADAT